MSLAHLIPADLAVKQQTVIVTVTKVPTRQVFDLGSVRVVYYKVTTTAINFDGLTVGVTNPGDCDFYSDGVSQIPESGIVESRDGVAYGIPLESNINSISYANNGSVVPLVGSEGTTVAPRYMAFAPTFITLDGGSAVVPYVGAQNPTATCSIFLEYV